MTNSSATFFSNKVILAPMVRMNTLPFRLLSLDYGADTVYGEEIIDYKLLRSIRKYNEVLDTVDYIDKTDGSLIFRTCSKERNSVIFQLGTNNPERAAEAAALIEKDVAGVDVNMGCPKHFSVSGGMGAALLSNLPNAQNIIRSLKNRVSIPVTCKIRVLDDTQQTIEFCKVMEQSGVAAIAVHGRTPSERPHHRNRINVIKQIRNSLSIPIIANGGSNDIDTYEDISKFKEETSCSSVMLARSAQYNPSIFRKKGKLLLDDVIKAFLKYAIDYDNCFPNTKYCIQSMLRDLQDTPTGKKFLETQNLEQICEIWNMGNYCRQRMQEFRSKGFFVQCPIIIETPRKKFKSDRDVLTMRSVFNRSNFSNDSELPKTVLLKLSLKTKILPPKYETRNVNKLFQSTVTYDGKKYGSSHWEKNKKSAEQGAAIVCLCYLKVYDEKEYHTKGIII